MKVELLCSCEKEELEKRIQKVAAAGKLSRFKGNVFEVLENCNDYEKNLKLIKRIISMGHKSIIEHDYLVFAISDVTPIIEQTIIGNRLTSFTIKSRREVDFRTAGFYTPEFRDSNLNIHPQNEQLKEKYEAIVLSFGANVSNKMNIPGEELDFVLGGNELLEYKKMPDFKDKKVAVIGGGNVAMDTSRTIKKMGAKDVYVIYRRAEEQMPSERKEIESAKNEGIEFIFQTNILKILKSNQIECIKTELVEKQGETRKVPVNIEGSNYLMDIDYVVMAVGAKPNEKVIKKLNLETTKWGCIKVDENYKTSDSKIYAVGDLIGTKKTVAWAARSGFECAKIINKK